MKGDNMSMNWNYKIDLKDEKVFNTIESEYSCKFPTDLKKFIIEHNAATPDANCVDINGIERVYDETLSYNQEETDASTFTSASKAVGSHLYIPFAKDPFGNYFCYSVKTKTIAFYSHEEQEVDDTDLSLKEFIDSLH